MKKQILTLIMGIMIGAVMTASVFLIFKPKSARNVPDFSNFDKDSSGFSFDKEGRRSRNSDETSESNSVEENKIEKESNDEKQN